MTPQMNSIKQYRYGSLIPNFDITAAHQQTPLIDSNNLAPDSFKNTTTILLQAQPQSNMIMSGASGMAYGATGYISSPGVAAAQGSVMMTMG